MKIGEDIEETEPNTALYYYNKAFFLLQNEKDSNLFAETYLRIANAYELKGNIDTSMVYFLKALKLYSLTKNYKNLGSCYNGIGNLYYYKFDLSNAIQYYQKSIEVFEKMSNQELNIANELHNIGLVHHDNNNYTKALEYYKKALVVFKKNGVKYWISNCYNSMASAFMDMHQNDSAIFYHEKAIYFANKDNDIFNMEMIYANLGQVYLKKKNFQKSLEYYILAENLAKKLNDEIGYADIYQGLGTLFLKMGEQYKSIRYLKKSIFYAKKTQSREYLKQSYFLLKENYKTIHDYQNAIIYADLLAVIKDSIYSVNKAKAIAKTEALYQDKQKQLMINNLEKENALSKEKSKKQLIFLIAVIVGFLIVSVFLILIFRLMKKQKNINQILSSKNIEILSQRDEIEAQRDLVVTQKEEIQLINQDISESIDYAKRIQESILPNHDVLSKFISESFTFFKPRNVVSGDFYWWVHMKLDNMLVTAVSDCTGHGVPGAFMSMLGISFLREIVTKEYVSHPGVILRKLRKEIIHALKQKGEFGGQKDGMDMSVVSINLDTLEIQYAGANNPLYIITNKELRITNEKIVKFKQVN
ncbi:MAG: tetratricopeptide repeat protein, partial [Bacteroidales bacterium]|nr:tetratricopeptide repeat protein [Bacteroidales bacterium]